MKKRTVKKIKRKKKYTYVLGVLLVLVLGMVFYHMNSQSRIQEQASHILDSGDKNVNKEEKGYAISSDSKLATQTGEKILQNGGNAVDAAVAMSYVLSVVEPNATGLGGGGCMLIYDPATQAYSFYDYGSEASQSGFSWKILVPGMVSGLETVWNDFGSMKRENLMEDAISYCDGFQINSVLANRINRASGLLGKESVFYQEGRWLEEGDQLVQKELKETLLAIRDGGAEEFYRGSIAQKICEKTGMSMYDLAAYETLIKEPVVGEYLGGTIAGAPAPYSGVTLIQMLKMFELLDTASPKENPGEYIKDLHDITMLSHADRLQKVYDDRFGEKIFQQDYITDSYLKELLESNIEDIEFEEENEDTTGFTVMDGNGMIVSSTSTLSSFFGDKTQVAGFFLNNTGVNFGQGVNRSVKGKRPRTHIAPVILRTEDSVMAAASPGGNVIVKVMATVLDDICRHHTDPQEAVEKQRVLFKKQNLIYYETGYKTESVVDVTGCSYSLVPFPDHASFGNISLVGFDRKEGFFAVSDQHRKGYGLASN